MDVVVVWCVYGVFWSFRIEWVGNFFDLWWWWLGFFMGFVFCIVDVELGVIVLRNCSYFYFWRGNDIGVDVMNLWFCLCNVEYDF